MGFPGGSVVKNPPVMQKMQEAPGSNPGLGRSPGGHADALQYSCLENPMDRGDASSIFILFSFLSCRGFFVFHLVS